MKHLIKKILREELIVESGGAFSEALAVDLWKNVLAYPQSKTKKTYNYLVPRLCTMKIFMINKHKDDYKHVENKKICYRKEPYKINDIGQAVFSDKSCSEDQINISESSDFHLCLNKKYISDIDYNNMKNTNIPTNNNGINPFPILN